MSMTFSTYLFLGIASVGIALYWLRLLARDWVLDWLDAYPSTESDQWSNIHDRLKELARRARQEAPELWILPEFSPNALVLGSTSGGTSVIALTEGVLHTVSFKEMEALLCLCLAQAKNPMSRRGALLSFVFYPFCAALGFLPRSFWFFLSPLLRLILLFLSQPEKFLRTDEIAQKMLGTGDDLAAVLQTIYITSRKIKLRRWNLAFDHLFIVSPMQLQSDPIFLFSKLPSVAQRRERILARSLSC